MDVEKRKRILRRFIWAPHKTDKARGRWVCEDYCRAKVAHGSRAVTFGQCHCTPVEEVEGYGLCRQHAEKLRAELGIIPPIEEIIADERWWTDGRIKAIQQIALKGRVLACRGPIQRSVSLCLKGRGLIETRVVEYTEWWVLSATGQRVVREKWPAVPITDPAESEAAARRRDLDRLANRVGNLSKDEYRYVLEEAAKVFQFRNAYGAPPKTED